MSRGTNDTITGEFTSGGTLIGRGGNDILEGRFGNDIIEGDSGADTLTGGNGSDRFVYRNVSDAGDVITDFSVGAGGDVLVIADLIATIGYSGATPFADQILRLVALGSDTLVQVDADGRTGAEGFKTLVTLHGVAPTALTSQNFDAADAPIIFVPSNAPAAISITSTAMEENAAPGTPVASLFLDNGGPDGAISYSLVNDAGGRFAIDGSTLVVGSGGALDFESSPSQLITVRETDAGGDSFLKSFTIAVTDGIDTFTGTAGNDRLTGTAGSDLMSGGAGNDLIFALGGRDAVDGGDGIDAVSYSTSNLAVTVNLALGTGTGGDAEGDFYVNIENAIGSRFNDKLVGSAGDNALSGGRGRDLMTGGAGRDSFVFGSLQDSGKKAATRDVISDFQHKTDKIDLSVIDANTHKGGNQAFHFIGLNAFGHVSGELHDVRVNKPGTAHDMTIVEGDVNGDGKADFQIELTGLKTLTKVDFVL